MPERCSAKGRAGTPASGRLLWVDIEGRALHIFDPARGHDRAIPLGRPRRRRGAD